MKKLSLFFLIPQILMATELSNYLFKNSDENLKTESFTLIKNGKKIYEKTAIDADKQFILWSMSKSITSLLIGIAQDKNLLSIEEPITKYIKKLPQDKIQTLSKIKIKHVLEMSSGIDWKEIYDESPFRSNVVDMLYNRDIKSMGTYPLLQNIIHKPGEKFNYSSGDTNILNLILKNILKETNYKTYPWDWLFTPLDIENASFEMDQSETFVGSSYVYLSINDLLKIGNLILNKGAYKNKQIISKDYIKYATSISQNMQNKYCLRDKDRTYGAQFWLNASCPDGKIPFKGVDESLVIMLGYSGQNLLIFPKSNSLAVRFASDKGRALELSKYLPLVQGALNEN